MSKKLTVLVTKAPIALFSNGEEIKLKLGECLVINGRIKIFTKSKLVNYPISHILGLILDRWAFFFKI